MAPVPEDILSPPWLVCEYAGPGTSFLCCSRRIWLTVLSPSPLLRDLFGHHPLQSGLSSHLWGGSVGGGCCLPEGHRLYRLSSAISSLAAGIRGGIFTLVFARLNIRLRNCLFRSLVSQETSFFDENRTGWSLLGTLGVQDASFLWDPTAAWLALLALPIVQLRVEPWGVKLPGEVLR